MIKVVILNHNKPENADKLFEQLSEAFDVELWDSGSDPDKIPIHLTEAFGNIYWTGAWNEIMRRYSDCDAVWMLGCDIELRNGASEYHWQLSELCQNWEEHGGWGCWSPCIEGRAHPFMQAEHYARHVLCKVRNVEGMAMAVSGRLMREVGQFEVDCKIGFGQDYWLCYRARQMGAINFIDGSVRVYHPPEIGYSETEAHDQMERAFTERYGVDFRRTIFEYDERWNGNLIGFDDEVDDNITPEEKDMLTVITVDNGWGIADFERILERVTPDFTKLVMRKGISAFGIVGDGEIVPHDYDMDLLIRKADVALFAKVGPANEAAYKQIVAAGVPTVVHAGHQQGMIDHEKNGYLFGNDDWAVQWVTMLLQDESIRKRFKAARAEAARSQPVPEIAAASEPETPSVEDVKTKVTVITPTYQRDKRIIQRAINCMQLQTVKDWEMLVCSDGGDEPEVRHLVEATGDDRVKYHHLESKLEGDFGNTCRAEMLKRAAGQYVIFLDDDNVILPEYLEKMTLVLDNNHSVDFAVCHVMHFGPLNEGVLGKPPIVLKGDPVKLYHIDPLQILVRREVMQKIGWDTNKGYLADGYTLERLGDNHRHLTIPEVLGIHM